MADEEMPPESAPELMKEESAGTQDSYQTDYEYEDDDIDEEGSDLDGEGSNSGSETDEVEDNKSYAASSSGSSKREDTSVGVKKLVQDVKELNTFHSKNNEACSSVDNNGGIRCFYLNREQFHLISVWIILTPERFQLNEERAFAWGLDQELAIRLDFGSQYLQNEHVLPKVHF